ncbi:MAG: flagellar hook capping protein [Lachnospiraceae bacterium]|jgi:flagellar basal-body rod modification protein FlgD|nr:flagellar hook capping protein [Lachnospiraceae bacterium]
MADNLSVSGTSNPYQTQYYTAQSNDKNTISMTGFFQLLATQLQNQDMSNPMDNSEIMAQMTQMAMVQSMTAMNDAMKNSTAVNTQTYAAGLVGQEVTMAVTTENAYGQETPIDVKYAKVEWVNFTSGNPTIKVEGDDREYQLTHLVGMGRVPNPFKNSTEGEDVDDKDDVDNEGDGDEGEKVKSVRRLAALKEDDEQDFDRDLENDLTAALI